MDPKTAETAYRHIQFIEQAINSGTIWGLDCAEGIAISASNEFEGLDVYPFWSDKEYAQAAANGAWKGYKASSMPLTDFMENWLPGMHEDQILAGTNWNAELTGKETQPLQLALELAEYIIANGKKVNFKLYKSVKEYRDGVKEEMEG